MFFNVGFVRYMLYVTDMSMEIISYTNYHIGAPKFRSFCIFHLSKTTLCHNPTINILSHKQACVDHLMSKDHFVIGR